jgi:glutathione S-transferase
MEPIHYYQPGTCALSELIVLEWIGEPYRAVRLSREDKQRPEYRAIHPEGQVPAMKFDGTAVHQNNALLAHLADTHPTANLAPAPGTLERAQVNQWMTWFDSTYHAAHYPIFKAAAFSDDESWHGPLAEKAQKRVGELLARLDKHLEGRKWFLLDRRTVLDAYFVAIGRWAARWFDYPTKFPNVAKYLERMDQDEGVRRAKAIESGERTGPDGAFLGHIPLA